MSDINVISRTQKIIVDPASQTVSIINAGPQGPGGPPGSGGGGATIEESVDAVAAALVEGAGIDIVYDDGAGTITVTSTSTGSDEVWIGSTEPTDPDIELWYDPDADPGASPVTAEDAVDAVATALVAGNNIDITYDDGAGTITVAVEDDVVDSVTVNTIWTGTTAAYTALGTYDSATLYFLT